MKKIFILSLTLTMIGSCTFKQDVTFKKNWSGDMSCEIDMSAMVTLMESGEDSGNILEEEDSKNKIKRLKETPGIKKVKVEETQKGIYKISYSFKDITALNKSGNILFSDDKAPQEFTYFDLRDKQTLYFSMPFTGSDENAESEGAEDNSMSESFTYELTMTFPKKIKSLETKTTASLNAAKNQVTYKTDILTMTTKGYEPGMLIKFEK